MAENLYPYGYSGTMLTWDQMMVKNNVKNLHPELLRRFKALIEYAATQGVPLGVGDGWRVQPDPPPPGFAQPGNSWHESCPVSPTTPSALAIDTVLDSSWAWMENNVAAFGLRSFRDVNDEPWHIQPVEIPKSRSYATVLPPLEHWALPGETGDDFLSALTPQEQRDLYERIKGCTPGPYTDTMRGMGGDGDGHRRYILDDQDGNYIVGLLQHIVAQLDAQVEAGT